MKLKDICIDMHQGINTVADKVEYIDSGIPILQSKNITCGYIDLHDVRFLSEKDYEKYQEKYQPKINDLLVSNIGTIGKTVIVNKKEKFLIAWNIFMIKTNPNVINSKFLKYYFDYLDNINYYNQFLTGGTVKFVNKKNMENILIPDLSLDEQICISTKLDKIYKMIELRKNEIEKCNNLIKSQFIEMFGDLLSTDIKYDKHKLAEVANISSSKRIYASEYVTEGIPFYRSKEIIELGHNKKPSVELFITQKKYDEVKEKYGVPKKGDILITAVGTVGETWIVNNDKPFYYKDGNLLLISLKKEMSELFFKYSLDILVEDFKKKNISGSSYGALTIEKFKNMNIVYPPIELQRKFAQIVSQINKQKFEFEKSLKKLEELQASLMQEYFG